MKNEAKAEFQIGTDKIEESIAIKQEIEEIKKFISDEKQKIVLINQEIEAKNRHDQDVTSEIKTLDVKLQEAEQKLYELKEEKIRFETEHKTTQEVIANLSGRKEKEENVLEGQINEASTLKARAEKLYTEGTQQIKQASQDLDADVPNVIKEGTMEIPTKNIQEAVNNTTVSPSQSTDSFSTESTFTTQEEPSYTSQEETFSSMDDDNEGNN